MAKSVDGLIADVGARVHSLLHDEVIQHTILVMRELGGALSQLAGQVRGGGSLSEAQKTELQAILLPLTSESIREALHKGELHITNGIIRDNSKV